MMLLGLVAVTSVGVLAVGSAATAQTGDSLENEQVRTAMLELDTDVASVAGNDGEVRTTEFDLDRGSLSVTDAGTITVTRHGLDGTETVVDRSLGAVEYSGATTMVYQSGGVWSVTDGRTQLVSAPSVGYRSNGDGTEGTLVVPVTTVRGGDSGLDGRVRMTKNATSSTMETVRIPEGERVTVEISGPYYRGWAAHFRERVGEGSVTVDHATRTATVTLGEYAITDTVEDGIASSGDVVIDTSGTVDSTIAAQNVTHTDGTITCDAGSGSDCYEETGDAGNAPLDAAIAESMDEASETATATSINSTDAPLTSGTYYVGGDAHVTDDLTIDVGTGNVTLLVDGDLALDNAAINVQNATGDNAARVYVSGDVAIAGGIGGISVADDDATRFQLYGTSEMHFGVGQSNSVDVTGLVYAPRRTDASGTNDAVALGDLDSATSSCSTGVDVCLGQGTTTFTGAVVAGSTEIRASVDLTYDDDLAALTPTLPATSDPRPGIAHLTVSVNDVEFDD